LAGGAASRAAAAAASTDCWLIIRRLLRLATASSASRFDTSTGDGGIGDDDFKWPPAAGESSDRVGEILRSPALSLLTLLSPILCS
jgi:hypothetical protein